MSENRKQPCPLCGDAVPPATMTVSSGSYRHCKRCDLVFLEPSQRLDPAAEHAHYLTHENAVNDPRYRKFLSQLATPMTERLPQGAHGLDYGAGPGPALAAIFAEQGFPTAIYDPFFAPDESVLDETYDFIACTEVIEHLYQPSEDFARFDKLLRPGGLLGLMTELRPPLARFPEWYYHRDPTHVCFYSGDTIHWIAQRFDWQIVQLERRVIILTKGREE